MYKRQGEDLALLEIPQEVPRSVDIHIEEVLERAVADASVLIHLRDHLSIGVVDCASVIRDRAAEGAAAFLAAGVGVRLFPGEGVRITVGDAVATAAVLGAAAAWCGASRRSA